MRSRTCTRPSSTLGTTAAGEGWGTHSRGELGYSDPTGNTVSDERRTEARDAATSVAGQATAALEALQRAQDRLADVVSPSRIRA